MLREEADANDPTFSRFQSLVRVYHVKHRARLLNGIDVPREGEWINPEECVTNDFEEIRSRIQEI